MKRGGGATGVGAPPTKRHWSHGLLASMDDPKVIVSSNEAAVMIKDMYPKARHHYLVLPRDHIPNLTSLTPSHIPLLHNMLQLARDYVSELKKPTTDQFKFGFHAVPSMARLHMHVVSRDLDSPSLKHKKHWNSFTTGFFIDAQSVLSSLEDKGRVELMDRSKYDLMLKTPLKCHVCGQEMTNMPRLKAHIVQHFPN